jgi:pimeloyl-ACP methyl ester carboxylesterase
VTTPWTDREATVNGVRLHYVEAGAGPLVVLLHGFPEFWYSWRFQIPVLAAAGYRVVAPDMRGYNLSEKPGGVSSYRIEHLVDDVVALIRHLGEKSAVIVGHDWGGVVAWYLPMLRPEAVRGLVVMNAPHPVRFLSVLMTPAQFFRSLYVFFFQLPWIPEALLSCCGYKALDDALSSGPAKMSEEDRRLYREAIAQPGALTAALNYYRAAGRRGPMRIQREARRIEVPTLLIWGERDAFLRTSNTEGLEPHVLDLSIERIPSGSHWVQVDSAERVNELLTGYLKALPRHDR